ncbi:D-glycero-alpha-D-manno-heptose-1,7-bisphosphate 7-phosphatase [Uliginosibacterium sp. sgz301328]|uniref:D-glycero-alpha-D-manno-heptose-1,7-bisphosphate 7-phosphatase n=1 Tax=Uliginosibacterium sp. sgz301328 TaxID=3243764 RepID=UPI00359D4960
MALRPAVFLDKDGTLLQDVPYNVEPRLMKFAPQAAAALHVLGRLGMPLVVVSNQPGVARGCFEHARLRGVTNRLHEMFAANGARLSGCYWCPHHPQGTVAEYARDCDCRKPAPGLLLTAARELGLDLSRSWFIGDILDDVEAGHRAGCQSILVDNGGETEWRQDCAARVPDAIADDLHDAALHIASALYRGQAA